MLGVVSFGSAFHASCEGGARRDPITRHAPDRDARAIATRSIPENGRS